MKRIIKTIALGLLMVVSMSSFAKKAPNPLKSYSSKEIISTYVDAITSGSTELNKYLFANDFQYENTSNKDKFNRRQYMNFLSKNKGLKFDCETKTEIIDETGESCVAKTTMKFSSFTRVDYISLIQKNDAWVVSKVVTTYP